ncbi:MAG: periplasmic heavy metal sensor [Planctomycetaceae bacterium]|nr:periplasmic heavy metal sensor [Planctomycetaceae bacterium]
MSLRVRAQFLVGLTVFFAVFTVAPHVNGQQPADKHVHRASATTLATDADLGAELRKLQIKVAELEAALTSQHQARYAANPSVNDPSMQKMQGMGMGMMKGPGGMKQGANSGSQGMSMGMMGGGMEGGMGMMSGGGMGGMKDMSSGSGGMGMGMGMMKGMGMMGRNPSMKSSMSGMGSMGSMNMPSALPGFAGASHLYHIGETGFFLDHPQHIALSDDQQLQLNRIKEASLLSTATTERKIDEAEQELWTLTAEGEPDITKIEAKVKEIAQLQVDNRIAFIRSVGKAAEVLTQEQRQTLVGMAMADDTN